TSVPAGTRTREGVADNEESQPQQPAVRSLIRTGGGHVRNRLLITLLWTLLATAAAGFLFDVEQAWAWQKDPDSTVDPAKVVTSRLLPAPDVTLGDQDATAAGIADVIVGANDTTSGPPDPPPSGTTFWV